MLCGSFASEHCRDPGVPRPNFHPLPPPTRAGSPLFAGVRRHDCESTKRRANGAGNRDLRHRRVDLDRDLVFANLERYRTHGSMVHRTSRLLQILHTPPSHHRVVLMGDNVRLASCCVKPKTTRSCGRSSGVHNIKRKSLHPKHLRDELASGSGPAFPPSFHCNSAASRQVFRRLCTIADRRVPSGNPHVPRSICACFPCTLSTAPTFGFSAAFACDFRRYSSGHDRRKMGEIQAVAEICGKRRSGVPRPLQIAVGNASAHKLWHVEHCQ